MNQYRYVLEPYKGMSSRYKCPECSKGRTFSRYINFETGEYLADHVGRCNRELKCGYHYMPRQFLEEGGEIKENEIKKAKPSWGYQKEVSRPNSFMPIDAFKKSRSAYKDNHFVQHLLTLFGEEVTRQLISLYHIGTSKFWPGATVFWQIDCNGNIRAGKIMLYNPKTGKRVKEPYNHISWAHKALKLTDFIPKQCFFGEHLLRDYKKPVAIVESEKTAIISSVYYPQFVWLAVGSLTNLNLERCKILSGRKVFLFPDLNAFKKWKEKAKELNSLISNSCFQVSDLLENNAIEEERKQGLDLADYLVRFKFEYFLQGQVPEQAAPNLENNVAPQDETPYQDQWNKLAGKYPNLNFLQERLGLEILSSSAC